MPKILQLNVTANWGSTGKIAHGIGEIILKRGWDSALAYGRNVINTNSQLIKVGHMRDVYAHFLGNFIFDREGLGSKRATKRLIEQIKEYAPDIIHLHNIHDHWLNYPILFEYLASVDTPVVWTFHDCWAFTGGCAHFENAGCFKWRDERCEGKCGLGHRLAAKQFELRRQLIGRLGNRLTVVCVSQWLADYVGQSYLSEAGANVTVLRNGINVNGVFRPGIAPKEKMILGVSNVWPAYKGINDFKELRSMLPDDVAITLVGLNQKQINGLPKGITGLTRTSSADELAALYNRASAFVNPTYNDSFPTVNLEALACGTPVVTYRTGGSPEAVDTATGIVVDKGDKAGLAKAIMEVVDNPGRFCSEACRERAVREFDKDVQFGKYINLYKSLMAKA